MSRYPASIGTRCGLRGERRGWLRGRPTPIPSGVTSGGRPLWTPTASLIARGPPAQTPEKAVRRLGRFISASSGVRPQHRPGCSQSDGGADAQSSWLSRKLSTSDPGLCRSPRSQDASCPSGRGRSLPSCGLAAPAGSHRGPGARGRSALRLLRSFSRQPVGLLVACEPRVTRNVHL